MTLSTTITTEQGLLTASVPALLGIQSVWALPIIAVGVLLALWGLYVHWQKIDQHPRDVDYLPRQRDNEKIPKGRYLTEVNNDGQILVPAGVRDKDYGDGEFGPGTWWIIELWSASITKSPGINIPIQWAGKQTSRNYITIPKEARDEHDIRHGDTVAVHLYWSGRNFDDEDDGEQYLYYPTNIEQ